MAVLFVCPVCKSALLMETSERSCSDCGRVFLYSEGYPVMLPDPKDGQKQAVTRMFEAINQSLEEKGLSRFSTFINWGYAPLGDRNPLPRTVMANSLSLLDEIVDGIDMNGSTILETACGRGGNIRALCRKFKPEAIIGLDLTPSNIAFCQRSIRHQQSMFCVGDAERLPFADSTFDYVLNIEAADLYPNINLFFDESFRVLKPGGMLLFAEDLPLEKYEESEIYVREKGFEIRRNRDITRNVIHACELSISTRLRLLNETSCDDEDVYASMAAPGTRLMEEMKNGTRQYRIVQLVKPV